MHAYTYSHMPSSPPTKPILRGIERLALVTGAEICSTFDTPELTKLGTCDLIEEVVIGEDKVCTALALFVICMCVRGNMRPHRGGCDRRGQDMYVVCGCVMCYVYPHM
jgi:hypothetical protein